MNDDDDFWADHDPNCHGEPSSFVDDPDYDEGFAWDCCESQGGAPGCLVTKHKANVNQVVDRSPTPSTLLTLPPLPAIQLQTNDSVPSHLPVFNLAPLNGVGDANGQSTLPPISGGLVASTLSTSPSAQTHVSGQKRKAEYDLPFCKSCNERYDPANN